MQIRTRMGISIDGFIATMDGLPAFVAMPGFVPHGSYDWPTFDAQIDAVIMGRAGLDAGLRNSDWPWPGKHIYVLTSKPVPAEVPAHVVVADSTPSGLLRKLQATEITGDTFLLGGRRTLHAFLSIDAIDRLELLQLPLVLGQGVPFSPPGTRRLSLHLREHHVFPDGTIYHAYQTVRTPSGADIPADAAPNSIV